MSSPNLESLPMELITEIFSHLDTFKSVADLASVSRYLHESWRQDSTRIYLRVAPRDLAGYEAAIELLEMQLSQRNDSQEINDNEVSAVLVAKEATTPKMHQEEGSVATASQKANMMQDNAKLVNTAYKVFSENIMALPESEERRKDIEEHFKFCIYRVLLLAIATPENADTFLDQNDIEKRTFSDLDHPARTYTKSIRFKPSGKYPTYSLAERQHVFVGKHLDVPWSESSLTISSTFWPMFLFDPKEIGTEFMLSTVW